MNSPLDATPADLPSGSQQIMGEYRALLKDLRRDCENPEKHVRLARFYLKVGHRNRAYSALKAAKALRPLGQTSYRLLGKLYEEDGDYDAARRVYLQWRNYQPQNAEALLALGKIYRHLGEIPKGVDVLAQAVRHDADLAEAYEILADLALDSRESDRALTYLNHLKGLTPNRPSVYLRSAKALLAKGMTDRAILDLRHAQDISPKDGEIRLQLAQIYLEEGLPKHALQSLEPLLGESPCPISNALFLAFEARRALGEWAEAESLLIRLERELPEDPRGPLERARIRRERGDLDGALPLYEKADKLAAEDPTPGLELARFLEEKDQTEKAREVLVELSQRFPQKAEIFEHLGILETRRGEASQALASFARALEIEADRASTLRARSRLFLQEGQYQDAIADLDEALHLDPDGSTEADDLDLIRDHENFREAFRLHGEVVKSLARGDSVTAQKQLTEIVRLAPEHARWLSDLADVARVNGDFETALEALRKLEDHEDHRATALRSRADLLYRLDRFEESNRAYETLLETDSDDTAGRFRLLRVLRHRLLDRTVPADSFQALEAAYRDQLETRDDEARTRLELALLHLGMGSHLFDSKIWVSAVETHLQNLPTSLSEMERTRSHAIRIELFRLRQEPEALEKAVADWVRFAPDDPDAAFVQLLALRSHLKPRAGRLQAETHCAQFPSDGRLYDQHFRFLREECQELPQGTQLRDSARLEVMQQAADAATSPHAALRLGFAHLYLSPPEAQLEGLTLASAAFKKAADLAPDNPWPWWGGVRTVASGIDAARGGRTAWERARGAAQAAVRRFPRHPYLLFELGRILLLSDDPLDQKEGRDALDRATSQGPRLFAPAEVLLGRYLEASGYDFDAYHHTLKAFEEPEAIPFDRELHDRLQRLGMQ